MKRPREISDETLVRTDSLTKWYGSHTVAVEGLDLTVNRSEVYRFLIAYAVGFIVVAAISLQRRNVT